MYAVMYIKIDYPKSLLKMLKFFPFLLLFCTLNIFDTQKFTFHIKSSKKLKTKTVKRFLYHVFLKVFLNIQFLAVGKYMKAKIVLKIKFVRSLHISMYIVQVCIIICKESLIKKNVKGSLL